MECNCGGMTADHHVTKNYQKVGEYRKCSACGHILWMIKPDEIGPEDIEKVDVSRYVNRESVTVRGEG